MVIKLNEDYRILYVVVECRVRLAAADPAKMCVVQMAFYFGHLAIEGPRRQHIEIRCGEFNQIAFQMRRHGAGGQFFIRHAPIVLISASQMQLVSKMPATFRQVIIRHRIEYLRLCAELGWQRLHQRKSEALLVLKKARSKVWTAVGFDDFSAEEAWREHHLPAKHNVI